MTWREALHRRFLRVTRPVQSFSLLSTSPNKHLMTAGDPFAKIRVIRAFLRSFDVLDNVLQSYVLISGPFQASAQRTSAIASRPLPPVCSQR